MSPLAASKLLRLARHLRLRITQVRRTSTSRCPPGLEAFTMQFLTPTSVLGLLLAVTLGILVFHLAPRRSSGPHSSESAALIRAPMIAGKTLWLLAGILTAGVVFVILMDLYPQLWPWIPYQSQINA